MPEVKTSLGRINIFKHEGKVKITTHNPSETKREIKEAIWERFRYPFSDDIAVGESVIQFSGPISGALLSRSPLGLLDDGEIRLEESINSVIVRHFISYTQIAILWAVACGAAIPLYFFTLSYFAPMMILLGPLMLFRMLVLIIAIGIIRFESLLLECLRKANGKVIREVD